MFALLLFLSSFGFYLHGASVSLDGGDSGEFIASSYSLGVPHAPGYPLYQLLGKALHFLMPFSTPSYRCHILSALIISFLLVLAYKFLISNFSPQSRWPSILVILFLATRPLVIEQARVVEVFGLNAFFALGILYVLQKKQFLLAAFLFGLGLGNHHTLLIVLPFFFFYRRNEQILPAFLFFVLGLSIYVYLPLRAATHPPVNFGDPETWHRFWAVVTRKEFGSTSLHPSALPFRTGTLILEQTEVFLGRVVAQVGWGGIVLAFAGTVIGWTRRNQRWMAALALVGWLGLGWGFEIYSNLSPFSDISQWRLERFYFIPLLSSVLLMALAFEAAAARLITLIVALLLFAQPLLAIPFQSEFRHNTAFRDLATSILRSAPENTRLVIDRVLFDEPTSALLVATITEKRRSDVRFLYRPGTLFEPVYGVDLLDLSWDDRFARQLRVEEQVFKEATFPIRCLAFEKANTPFAKPVLEGLLYTEGKRKDVFPLLIQRGLSAEDYPTRLIAVHMPYVRGKAALEDGHIDQAKRWFGMAIQQGQGMSWLASNVGGVYAHHDMIAEAKVAFETAVKNDRYFFEAQYGRGFVALKENQFDQAVESYRMATKISPQRSEAFYMLGVAAQHAKRREECGEAWTKYLALEPRGKMAAIVRKELEDMKWK